MIASPLSSASPTSATVFSVISPAGTITQTERGAFSAETRSWTEEAPWAPSPASAATASGLTSKATISWPSRIRRRAMLAPMRPRPTIPSSIDNLRW